MKFKFRCQKTLFTTILTATNILSYAANNNEISVSYRYENLFAAFSNLPPILLSLNFYLRRRRLAAKYHSHRVLGAANKMMHVNLFPV